MILARTGGKQRKVYQLITQFSSKVEKKANSQIYDVIIIGGGHAGCEAAHISTLTGAKTLLITQSHSTIGEMSCNVSSSLIAKNHPLIAILTTCSRVSEELAKQP